MNSCVFCTSSREQRHHQRNGIGVVRRRTIDDALAQIGQRPFCEVLEVVEHEIGDDPVKFAERARSDSHCSTASQPMLSMEEPICSSLQSCLEAVC